eukprot:g249.t1
MEAVDVHRVKQKSKKRKNGAAAAPAEYAMDKLHLLKVQDKSFVGYLVKKDSKSLVLEMNPELLTEDNMAKITKSYEVQWLKKSKHAKKDKEGLVQRFVFTDRYQENPKVEGVIGKEGSLVRDPTHRQMIRYQNEMEMYERDRSARETAEMPSTVQSDVPPLHDESAFESQKIESNHQENVNRLEDDEIRKYILREFEKNNFWKLSDLMDTDNLRGQSKGHIKRVLASVADYNASGLNSRRYQLKDKYLRD